MSTPPAGWYPDPQDAGKQRYWDGNAWTEHTADGSPQAGAGQASATTGGTTTSTGGGEPDTWTWQSIVVTMLCCQFIGPFGVINAGRAEQAIRAGDLAAAREHAAKAKKFTLWGIGAWFVLMVLYFGFIAVVGFSEFQTF